MTHSLEIFFILFRILRRSGIKSLSEHTNDIESFISYSVTFTSAVTNSYISQVMFGCIQKQERKPGKHLTFQMRTIKCEMKYENT